MSDVLGASKCDVWRIIIQTLTIGAKNFALCLGSFDLVVSIEKMSERRSIENFFEDIDADLARYAAEFRRNGFTSDKTMKYWREEDFNTLTVDVPPGHRRLILNMVSKLRTPEMKPHKRKLSPKKDYAQETLTGAPRSKRNILSVVESKVEAHKRALSPVERFIKIKEEELTSKNDEIAEKKRELDEWLGNIENVATINRKSTGTKCSNCHLRNHTVRTCSRKMFFCLSLRRPRKTQ